MGTPQVGKGARNPLLGLCSIKEREESNKDPGENVSVKERIRERIRTVYMATKAIPTYLPLHHVGVDPLVAERVNFGDSTGRKRGSESFTGIIRY